MFHLWRCGLACPRQLSWQPSPHFKARPLPYNHKYASSSTLNTSTYYLFIDTLIHILILQFSVIEMADFMSPSGPPPPKVPEGWKAQWNDQYKEWYAQPHAHLAAIRLLQLASTSTLIQPHLPD